MTKHMWVQVLSLAVQSLVVISLWVVAGGMIRGLYEMFMLGFTLFNYLPV